MLVNGSESAVWALGIRVCACDMDVEADVGVDVDAVGIAGLPGDVEGEMGI